MDIFVSKNLLLISLILLCSGLYFLVKRWPKGVDATFSQHAVTNKVSYVFYILLFVVSLLPLIIFFDRWFAPTYSVTEIFLTLIILSCLAQIACTFFIEKGRWTVPHRMFAGISAVLLMPCMLILANTNEISVTSRSFFVIGLLTMLIVVIVALVKRDRLKSQMLYQIGYYSAFFVPILIATYS